MPQSETFKNITQGILHVIIIGVICLFGAWLLLSGIGTYFLNRQAQPAEIPDVGKAQYGFIITATNESVFTNNYEKSFYIDERGVMTDKAVYTLHGYYELMEEGKKYLYHKSDIKFNEFYYGKIMVIDRTEAKR